MKRPDEVDDDFSRKIAELLELIERLPPDRIDELQKAIDDRKKAPPTSEAVEE